MDTKKKSKEHGLYRIVNAIGYAFGAGAVGGSVYHFVRGAYNSPIGARYVGGTQAASMNAPRLGGTFAVFGGLLSTFDYALVRIRKKEDPWNSIVAGAATGGVLSIRKGVVAASTSAVMFGFFLAVLNPPFGSK
ncbi:Mitochondrial import inner membrane translocase subunit TIM17-3 [Arabidopsis thaliana]|jgi:import inner membrane translocase subunit TIM17|uniref:Mitochondrial import inner membrane translocase subunit TIM17-3 n=3 Tax=Arabidopsis TaxID=3701 RepID=TI173_ARATH|nr:translocase inner membrane subunit 17-3 [Arabidopsis thaliana]Q9LYG1.1 RecName: Full=Mitochondrial import inner membrane translocase subunit TIM17-3 [Arabidopsis thaliana]KAG7601953.1 hypothetical protein ISN45_At05g010740 [Arabidopsis thaliana x Arabidopsis arenosa]AAO22630.1 putative membrane translocase [Arabidopsis thaliana]AAO42361.1 putative membrane translocase [Arabidopsis thaliana]AED91710.1 translocase inner membrane subunit 17-3 [Arabidopsis thaliana]OAO95212.1 TIM17-3 [Arabidop|eukprot:NP_196730.1 translocase inner membrane subunit 17-3 [Arabidopsis thaliana]